MRVADRVLVRAFQMSNCSAGGKCLLTGLLDVVTGEYKYSGHRVLERIVVFCFFFQAEDGIRDVAVTGVQTCALPIFACSPQHFKFEHEHTIAALSPEEVRMRLAEARARLLDSGVDLELLPAPPVGRG